MAPPHGGMEEVPRPVSKRHLSDDLTEEEQLALNPTFPYMPVDTENKGKRLKVWSFAAPHMRAFHLSWIGFMQAFISTFSAAPMAPVIRDSLSLTKPELANAGIATVTTVIFMRVAMGPVCDVLGPRYGMAGLLLIFAPATLCLGLTTNGANFLVARMFIGITLATFVTCQYWNSIMFNNRIVGLANATAGGWGNLGGGITQFLMPLIFTGVNANIGYIFRSWRYAMLIPGALQILAGTAVLYLGQDMPGGQYRFMKKTGQLEAKNPFQIFLLGCKNYRMWVLVVLYAFCFGVELTMNEIAATYFFDYFGVNLRVAGAIASSFGLMNLFARSIGGALSDWASKNYGMRGRLWNLWVLLTLEGLMCIGMGQLNKSLGGTIAFMILFSLFVQASEGATYGIVPFTSARAMGIIAGFVGAGGNAGASVNLAIWFRSGKYETYDGITYMGILIVCVAMLTFTIHFPPWGSMLFPPNKGSTEESYFLAEYSADEIAEGKDKKVARWIYNSQSERPPSYRVAEEADPEKSAVEMTGEN